MDKDTVLRTLFMVPKMAKAMKVLLDDDLYMVSDRGIWKGVPSKEEVKMTPGKLYPIQSIPLLGLTDTGRIRPEVFLESMRVPLTGVSVRNASMLYVSKPPSGLPAGIWLMREEMEDVQDVYQVLPVTTGEDSFAELGIIHCSIPEFIFEQLEDHGYTLDDFKPELMRSRIPCMPLLALTGDTSILCMTLCKWGVEPPYKFTVKMQDGNEVEGDGYAPDIKKWNKLKLKPRSKKMKGLGNPLEMTKKKEAKEEVEQAVEAAVVGTVQPVEQVQSTPLDITAAIPEPEAVEEAGIVVAAEPAVIQEEQSAAEGQEQKATASKRQRPNPQKAVDQKLAKDMEDLTKRLNAPIDGLTPDQFKEANAQIKRARDLVMVAVRYIANMSEAMTKTADGALEAYVAMKALFK